MQRDNGEVPHHPPTDHDLLSFEKNAPTSLGAKEDAIKAQLGISPVRYYQRLNRAIDTAAMMEEFPLLCARLRRKRDEREDSRQQAQSSQQV